MLVTHYNMSMWSVLHENPMADKMVGTLGSILQRKVTEAFSVKKHKHEKDKYPNMPDIWFEVQQPKARGKDQDDWAFEVISAESWGVPVELDQNGRVNDPEAEKTRQIIKEANDRFAKFNWTSSGARYTDLESHLRSQGVTSNRRIKDLFDIALEKGIITKSDKKKYFYHGLNTETINDQSEALPFDKPDNGEAPY